MKSIRKKKIALLMLFLVIAYSFCDCGFNAKERLQIQEYLNNKLGIDNYTIDWQKKETRIGTTVCRIHDKENDITFNLYNVLRVRGDYIPSIHWGYEDDYDLSVMQKMTENHSEGIKLLEPGEEGNPYEEEVLFEITYSDLEELESECQEFWEISEKVRALCDTDIKFTFKVLDTFEKPVDDKDFCPPIDYSIGDYSGYIGSEKLEGEEPVKSLDELTESAKEKYFIYGLTYQTPSVLNEMTDEDKQRIIEEDDYLRVYIVRDLQKAANPDNKAQVYKGEGGITSLSQESIAFEKKITKPLITFGGLYALLKEEGLEVKGSPEDFKYTANNGDVYEFSYDYWKGEDTYDCYYLKNGEKVYTELTEKNVLNHKMVLDITGIYIDFGIHFPYLSKDLGVRF